MRLTSREKTYVAILLVAIIIYFEYTYLVGPQTERIKASTEVVKTLETRLNLLENAESREIELNTQIKDGMNNVKVVMDKYFVNSEQEEIILLMHDILADSGIDATAFTFSDTGDIPLGDGSYKKIMVTMNFNSTYQDFERLLKKMWEFRKMVAVDNMTLSQNGDGRVDGNLDIGFYYLTGHEGVGYKDNLYQMIQDESFFNNNPFTLSPGAADFRINYLYIGGEEPGEAPYVSYEDIKGHWAEAIINDFGTKGYLTSTQSKTFGPDTPMTRGEFIIMLDRIYKWPVPDQPVDLKQFSDYTALGSYENSIAKAVYKGFISGVVVGYADNTLRPRDPLTYEEMEFIIQKLKSQPDFKWDSIAAVLKAEKGLDSPGVTNKKTGMSKAETVFLMSKVK